MELAVALFLLIAVICFGFEAARSSSLTAIGLLFMALAFLVPHLATLTNALHI